MQSPFAIAQVAKPGTSPNAHIMFAPELSGRSGEGRVGTEPFLDQRATFNQAAIIEDAIEYRYVIGGRVTIAAGSRLSWIESTEGGAACRLVETISKCYRDTDGDQLLDTVFYGGPAIDGVYLFPEVGQRDRALLHPVRFSIVPDDGSTFAHRIGISLTSLSLTPSGRYQATFDLALRGAGDWVRVDGATLPALLDETGRTVVNMLGSSTEIQVTGPEAFEYRIVQPFPEQPISARAVRTTRAPIYVPMWIPR